MSRTRPSRLSSVLRRVPRPLARGLAWVARIGALCALLYGAAGYATSRLIPAPVLTPATEGVQRAPGGNGSFADLELGPGEAFSWERLDCPGVDPRCDAVRASTGVELLGVSSVHTGRSGDARGSLDEVARSARLAGLDFVLLGDHAGDWLNEPGAMTPRRVSDVLLVPGQELVVDGVGRTLTIGLDTILPRWEGSPEELARRAERQGGFVAVVHPRSPRSRERWTGIDAPGIHGWEALDVSEVARIRLKDRWATYHLVSFLGGLVTGRAHASVLRLNREGAAAPGLMAYDSARARTPLTLLAALNHHPKARIGGVLVPGYTSFFRTHVNHVTVAQGPTGDARLDRSHLLRGLRDGAVFVSLGDAESARGFRAVGLGDSAQAPMGGALAWTPESQLLVRLPPAAPEPLLVRVVADGVETGWAEGHPGETLAFTVPRPGVWRVEAYRAGVPMGSARLNTRLWLLANPVEFRAAGDERLVRR